MRVRPLWKGPCSTYMRIGQVLWELSRIWPSRVGCLGTALFTSEGEKMRKFWFNYWSSWSIVECKLGGRRIWRYSVIADFFRGDTVIWIKNGRYSVLLSPSGDGKIQFLVRNTTVTVSIQKFDYGITVISEKINGNTVIQNLVRPPLYCAFWVN